MGKSKDLATLTNGGNIAGNFTVDTDTLHIDSTNDRIGFGTTSPSSFSGYNNISVKGGSSGSNFDFQNSSGTRVASIVSAPSTQLIVETLEDADVRIKTNNVERLIVDGSGRVTAPSQPYGEAEGLYGSSTSVSSGSIINWLTANHLNGGVTFSNSGRFTVPTAGRYLVHYRLYFYPDSPVSQYYQISVQKNGSEEAFMIDEEVMTTYSGSGKLDRGLSFTTVIRLAASDYLELKYHGSATASFYRGGPHNRFKVLLLS
jgi:hypothetical protein